MILKKLLAISFHLRCSVLTPKFSRRNRGALFYLHSGTLTKNEEKKGGESLIYQYF